MTTEEWVEAVVAAAPPLSERQKTIIRAIFQNTAQHINENAATTATEATPDPQAPDGTSPPPR
jgi:hypothetical protein